MDETTSDGGPDGLGGPQFLPLDPRHVTVERIGGWIFVVLVAGLPGVGLAAAMIATWPPGWLMGIGAVGVVVLVGLLGWFVHAWPVIAHRRSRYRADDWGLEIHRGVLWRSVINVPRSRIQHTDVRQGPLQRRYGLGKLVVHTAGTEHAAIELDGLRREEAMRLRDLLTAHEGEDETT
jgi:hypothetical protein